MLEEALTGFDGAVVAVSHDRYFLRKIATRIIAVSARCLCVCQGIPLHPCRHLFETLLRPCTP